MREQTEDAVMQRLDAKLAHRILAYQQSEHLTENDLSIRICPHEWEHLGYDRDDNSVSQCKLCGEVMEQ